MIIYQFLLFRRVCTFMQLEREKERGGEEGEERERERERRRDGGDELSSIIFYLFFHDMMNRGVHLIFLSSHSLYLSSRSLYLSECLSLVVSPLSYSVGGGRGAVLGMFRNTLAPLGYNKISVFSSSSPTSHSDPSYPLSPLFRTSLILSLTHSLTPSLHSLRSKFNISKVHRPSRLPLSTPPIPSLSPLLPLPLSPLSPLTK